VKEKNIDWALALSGGGARGLAHIGFLKGLEDSGFPKPSLIAGTSMGAIIGGLYACGISPPEMIRFIQTEFKISDYLDSFAFRLGGKVGRIFQTGQMLASLAGRPGVDPGQRVLKLLESLTGGKYFDETRIPFRCNAVDLFSGREVVFSSGSIARAMRASMSVPGFFEPLMDENMCLVDGGIYGNLPAAIARQEGYKRILAVNVNHFSQQSSGDIKNGPEVFFRCLECAVNVLEKEKRSGEELTIDVIDDADPFSFFRHRELIALGERRVTECKTELESFFKHHLNILEKLPEFRRNND